MTNPKNTPVVLVAGSANLDFVVRAPHIPAPGETVLGGAFQTFAGGKGANQAVACARAGGVATHMLLALGDDAFAAPIEASLQGAGVTLHVAVDRGAQAFPADRVESGEIGKINLKSGSDADALNDRIARGTSQHTGDAAGASEQRVEERALSRVGRAGKHDQRNSARVRRRLLAA
jgi:sugar/nucleoside kinase (ribokinase family)